MPCSTCQLFVTLLYPHFNIWYIHVMHIEVACEDVPSKSWRSFDVGKTR
jgi:hypothetical protein